MDIDVDWEKIIVRLRERVSELEFANLLLQLHVESLQGQAVEEAEK